MPGHSLWTGYSLFASGEEEIRLFGLGILVNIFKLIQLLRLRNTKLREARDILLPMLMIGEITV